MFPEFRNDDWLWLVPGVIAITILYLVLTSQR